MSLQMMPDRGFLKWQDFKTYIKDPWNKVDQAMYIVLLLAVILRFTLNDDHFVGARYVYAINLIMFYMRILQLYYISQRLGPNNSHCEFRFE